MKIKNFVLLLPALSVIALFVGGFLLTAAKSVYSITSESGLTFVAYQKVLLSREFQAAFVLTLIVSAVSTALSAIGGLALAIGLHRAAQHNAFLATLLQIPLAIPHLAAALVLLNLIAPSGLMARVFYGFGAINAPPDFPVLVNDAFGFGIIAAYVLKEIPFVAIVVLATLTQTGGEFEEVAQSLGASRWQRFRFVILPTVAPALAFSSLIVFAFVFGAFEIPFVLGRQFPAMLAIFGNRKFLSTDLSEKSEAFALAVLMTIAATFFVWLYLRLTSNDAKNERPTLF